VKEVLPAGGKAAEGLRGRRLPAPAFCLEGVGPPAAPGRSYFGDHRAAAGPSSARQTSGNSACGSCPLPLRRKLRFESGRPCPSAFFLSKSLDARTYRSRNQQNGEEGAAPQHAGRKGSCRSPICAPAPPPVASASRQDAEGRRPSEVPDDRRKPRLGRPHRGLDEAPSPSRGSHGGNWTIRIAVLRREAEER